MMLNDKWCKIVGGRPRMGFLWTLRIYAIFSFATELGSRGKSVNIVSHPRVSQRFLSPRKIHELCEKARRQTAEKLDRRCTTRSRQQVRTVLINLLTTMLQ